MSGQYLPYSTQSPTGKEHHFLFPPLSLSLSCWSPLSPCCVHNLTGIKTVVPPHQHQALLCLPAGVGPPPLYQGVAGDPLARGEGQAGGTSRVYIAVIFIQGGGNGKVR